MTIKIIFVLAIMHSVIMITIKKRVDNAFIVISTGAQVRLFQVSMMRECSCICVLASLQTKDCISNNHVRA